MPTLVECRDLFECNEVARKYGLDFIEINMSFPQYCADSLDVTALKKLCSDTGVGYTIHADEMLNPFDFNPKVSGAYFEVMRDTIRGAKELSAPIINLHLQKGVYTTLPGKVLMLNDVYREEYLAIGREFVSMCEEEIADSGVRIAIENVDSNPFTEAQLELISIMMKSPVFGLTLDTGHDRCLGHRDLAVFDKYPDRLIHMHLHDSDGRSAHLPLGEGDVDPGAVITRLAGGNTCLVEVKSVDGLAKSVSRLKALNIM